MSGVGIDNVPILTSTTGSDDEADVLLYCREVTLRRFAIQSGSCCTFGLPPNCDRTVFGCFCDRTFCRVVSWPICVSDFLEIIGRSSRKHLEVVHSGCSLLASGMISSTGNGQWAVLKIAYGLEAEQNLGVDVFCLQHNTKPDRPGNTFNNRKNRSVCSQVKRIKNQKMQLIMSRNYVVAQMLDVNV